MTVTKEHEPIPDEIINNFLDGVGNSEIKALMGSLFLRFPERDFSPSQMADEMNDRQHIPPAWDISVSGVTKYCRKSLKPVGEIILGREAWQARPEYRETRLALCGMLGSWSLRWADLSVQQLYGRTTLKLPRSPRTRHAVYSMILNASTPVSIAAAYAAHGQEYSRGGFKNQIYTLTELGFLEKSSNRATATSEKPANWQATSRRSQSIVTIAPTYAEPISELIQGVSAIRKGKDIDRYIQEAADITNDKDSFQALIEKSKVFSSRRHLIDRAAT